jgi:multiple sugar transport system permease protein
VWDKRYPALKKDQLMRSVPRSYVDPAAAQAGAGHADEVAIARPRPLMTYRAKEAAWAYLFLLPFFIGLVAFIVGPVVAAFAISFTSWDLLSPPVWIGLDNYREMAADAVFWTALGNTVYFTAVSVPLTLLLALGLATLMNNKLPGINLLRAIYFFPVTASIVAVSLLWAWMYTPNFGIINYMLSLVGLPTPGWLVDPKTAMPSIIIMSVWRGLGFNIVVFLAGLQSIPRDLYEAAQLDGAGEWNRFRKITVPLLTPTIFFGTVMALITSFQVFEQTYIMTQGGPGNATLTIVYDIFQNGFTFLRMGYASAMSFVLFAILFVITIIQVRLQTRWVHYA